MKSYEVNILNKKIMEKLIDEFIIIDQETSEFLGKEKYGKPWGKKEFFFELKNKWKYSIYSTKDRKVNGYLITSNYDNKIHAHRLALKTNLPAAQKIKITRLLYKKLEIEAKKDNIECLSAIVPIANQTTVKLYNRDGWVQMNKKQIEEFINERNMKAFSRSPNLLIDKFPNKNEPYVSFVLKYFYNY